MNKLLLGLLLVSGITFAQTEEVITETGTVTEVAEPPTFYVNEILEPYVNTFAAAMSADGWNIGKVKDFDVFILFDYEVDRNISTERKAAGLALGMNNDEQVFVLISIDAWLEMEEYAKQDLINHELMHDIFDVKHTSKLEDDKLMHPSAYPKSWADTFYRLIDAIKDLNKANGYE